MVWGNERPHSVPWVVSLGGGGREIEFSVFVKERGERHERQAAGEEMKRSEQRRETTGVCREGGEECGKINVCTIKEGKRIKTSQGFQ